MIKIRYIDYGIGYFCTDNGKSWIEINRNLKKYTELFQNVLEHEMGHDTGKRMDFLHDLKYHFNPLMQLKLFQFSLRHPRAFLSNSPLVFDKKGVGINWFMFALLGIFAGILIIGGVLI